MRFLDLKKNLKRDFSSLKKARLAILGDTSTQLLSQAIRGYGFEVGFDLDIFEADYNQIDRQILDSSSELYRFKPDFVLLFQASQKLIKSYYRKDNSRKRIYYF